MRDFHFGIAAGGCSVYGGGDAFKMQAHIRPLLVAEYHDGNASSGEVLLVTQVLVRAEKQVVTRLFGFQNQLAVFEFVPADSPDVSDLMLRKATRNGLWGSVVKRIFIRETELFPDSGLRSAKRI